MDSLIAVIYQSSTLGLKAVKNNFLSYFQYLPMQNSMFIYFFHVGAYIKPLGRNSKTTTLMIRRKHNYNNNDNDSIGGDNTNGNNIYFAARLY